MTYTNIIARFPLGCIVTNFGHLAEVSNYKQTGSDNWDLVVRSLQGRRCEWLANPDLCEQAGAAVTMHRNGLVGLA